MKKSLQFYLISIGLTVLIGIINGFLYPKILHGEPIFEVYYLVYYTIITIIVGALVLASYEYIQQSKKVTKSYI